MASQDTPTDRPVRKRRANGEESRLKILDAAREISAERGYEGTTIALVSERSGLPASSIYWHFKDKDALLAAVIERSFGRWLAGAGRWTPPGADTTVLERLTAAAQQTAKALEDAPDFLRLGLMLALERRPEEPSARTMFLSVREEAMSRTRSSYAEQFPDLDADAIAHLATFTMAMADGLFIAKEVGGDSVDLLHHFEIQAAALVAVADQLAQAPRRAVFGPNDP